jgi:hypothetical protein
MYLSSDEKSKMESYENPTDNIQWRMNGISERKRSVEVRGGLLAA